jgi:PAS domain S-box-containing protein
MIYNQAYAEVMGPKHPAGLGQCFDVVWAEAMVDLEPLVQAIHRGEPISVEDITLYIDRGSGPTEAHFAFSYTPVRDAGGAVVGLFCVCTETTSAVLAQRARDAERARWERLFTHAPGFIAIIEEPTHRFTYVNAAYRAIVGDRDYIGNPVRDVIPELVGQGILELLDTVYSSGQAQRVSGQVVTFDATPTTLAREAILDFVYQPIIDDDGNVTGIFVEGHETTERTLIERALRESEGRFRAAVEAVHGVLWTNSADGEMIGEQPGWSALTGQTQAQYDGYGWADALHPDDARPTIDAWNEALGARRPFEFEHRVRRRDGEWRHFAVRAIPALDEHGAIREWIGVHTDITGERAMQAALLESEQNYRFTVELHPQVAWTATPDGRLDHVAERWREWTGTSGLGDGWARGLHPEDLGYSTDAWAHAVTTGEAYDVEHRVARTDGSFRWARSRAYPRRGEGGQIIKWYGTTEDIDDRKRAEMQAFEAARELRGVVDALPGFVWTADEGGLINYASPSWYDYSGALPEESLGTGWADFVHPDDQPEALAAWAGSLQTGKPYEVELRFRAADGTYFWWLARARKQPENGRWIGTATELDTIVAARETLARSREDLERAVDTRTAELREAEEQLRQSQKLEAIGQLTGGVAHDFNNLLTVIRGSVDLLRRPGITEGRRERYTAAISDTVTRAAKLTGQLLAFARRQVLQPDVFDAVVGVASIGDMLRTLVGSRIQVEMQMFEAGALFVDADPSQFDTAIVNMAANARDAMSGEGTLTICVRDSNAIPANGGPAVAGDFVAVSIGDTGTGMAPEVQAQIFEPFYTTKRVGEGTGLGLSQVYGFAMQSGGDVRVHSVLGQGTVFTLYLPRVPAPAGPEADPAQSAPATQGDGICVLVVEDNPEVGMFARQTLAELGFAALFATNGHDALAELEKCKGRVDVVFSDVMMPGMSGIELGEEVRHRYPQVPVVLTSGYSHVLAQHGRSGFALLPKPYSMEQLAQTLRKAALRRQTVGS